MMDWSTETVPVCCQPGGNFSSCPQESWYAVVFRGNRTSCAKARSKPILRLYLQRGPGGRAGPDPYVAGTTEDYITRRDAEAPRNTRSTGVAVICNGALLIK